mmetsp:Transcript_2487/g.4172  ORF Transcript_2487/g.4172 Transcript_2487/m.4172 type:complete len:323 (-) Transcript_2487:469-1437(-)
MLERSAAIAADAKGSAISGARLPLGNKKCAGSALIMFVCATAGAACALLAGAATYKYGCCTCICCTGCCCCCCCACWATCTLTCTCCEMFWVSCAPITSARRSTKRRRNSGERLSRTDEMSLAAALTAPIAATVGVGAVAAMADTGLAWGISVLMYLLSCGRSAASFSLNRMSMSSLQLCSSSSASSSWFLLFSAKKSEFSVSIMRSGPEGSSSPAASNSPIIMVLSRLCWRCRGMGAPGLRLTRCAARFLTLSFRRFWPSISCVPFLSLLIMALLLSSLICMFVTSPVSLSIWSFSAVMRSFNPVTCVFSSDTSCPLPASK